MVCLYEIVVIISSLSAPSKKMKPAVGDLSDWGEKSVVAELSHLFTKAKNLIGKHTAVCLYEIVVIISSLSAPIGYYMSPDNAT